MIVVNGSRVVIVDDYVALSQTAASLILNRITQTPTTSLLVPTGTTPEGMYALLAAQSPATFEGVSFYNLDEYCESDTNGNYSLLGGDDSRSYQFYMNKHVLGALPSVHSFFPDVANVKQPGTYDRFIDENGGIDLAVNAIGEDGHTFGFNLPDDALDGQTHLVTVNAGTKTVNEKLTGATIPDYAITAGIQTGMKAREVITLVSGSRKAEILHKAIWDNVSAAIPATILRQHPNHTFIVDKAAAAKL